MKKFIAMLLMVSMMLTMISTAAFADDSAEIYMFINSPEYADAVEELIAAYKEVAPNVTINYETTQNDYPTLLKTKINAGECPDIFATTSGKEIVSYLDYSYDFSAEAAAAAMTDPVKSVMMYGEEVHGFPIKGNYFGIIYNKAIFEEVGLEFPTTFSELEKACEAISAAGYTPFSTGFAEWWVYKHVMQHFVNAAGDSEAIVNSIVAGESTISDHPMIYDNFFNFIDLVVKYGDAKPLECDLAGEEAAIGTGKAAMILGQGAWVEDDILAIDDAFQLGFNGYPVSEDPADCMIIAGSDQALRINKDSAVLQDVLDFVNWWYTSDYGKAWFTNVAGVIPPVVDAAAPDKEVVKQGQVLEAEKGAGAVSIVYSTDSFHEACGVILQSYIGGNVTKDEACAQIEAKWMDLDGTK
ncbi:MAG: extracellular solute-binding protein [Clostridiales bacterium]|nr:extracellular solute-binding protein [Clostridiales bacterium]